MIPEWIINGVAVVGVWYCAALLEAWWIKKKHRARE
jgi:hypothetical protein